MADCLECGNEFEEQATRCDVCDTVIVAERPELVAVAAYTAQFIAGNSIDDLTHRVGDAWPINDQICNSFIRQAENKFSGKNKHHSYYSEQNNPESIPARLSSFITGAKTFNELVSEFMSELVLAAVRSRASRIRSGNVVFMHYKNSSDHNDAGRLLAVMVDSTNGFKFDNNLVPQNADHINLNALKQAALFDLTLFSSTYPEIPERETYLKFIKGNSTGAFFKRAFGCENRADNGRSVAAFYEALVQYQEEHDLNEAFYDTVKRNVDRTFAAALDRRDQIPLRELVVIVESALPEGSELEDTFLNFLNTNEYQVNEFIEPTSYALNEVNWVVITPLDETFKAKVLKDSLGVEGSNATVQYNTNTHKLIININDPATREQLNRLVAPSD